ncbi:MAG TPA: type 4a pilus biogenesis protein PilO [Clostridia bacterium]|nr:type 4a pilus biogenesis protein PilO [Clostridia bacterium]
MKIKLSVREVLLVSLLAVAVLIYIYMSYLLFPSYTRLAKLNTELILKKQIAIDSDNAKKRLENLDSLLAKSKIRLENMEKKIPYNVRLPELVVNIDSKIASLDMDIQTISIGKPDTANKEYDIIPINVSMEGKYDNIIKFINYIEDNDRKFIIDNFILAPITRAEAMPFDISMRTFVLKDSKEDVIPEPDDYYFFKHNNGKSYPFLNNVQKVSVPEKGIENDIEEMEKKYDKLDDIIDGLKGIIPNNNEIGEGN